ncbi:MAG: hypothetical protein N0C90_00400, partial [Candidatus Thiodiazotropha endolucinida]|nr:hypothetical protein [Candidatus Thiodiazotropha taylori]MCW4259805.1 hypothetical protein [Candidatus Thiodiazotropha endolucinida]
WPCKIDLSPLPSPVAFFPLTVPSLLLFIFYFGWPFAFLYLGFHYAVFASFLFLFGVFSG